MSIELNITYKRGQYRILKNGKTLQYASDYGYILHTKGRDNEPINCYCGLFTGEKTAYIINQYINGVFDEHKIMLYFHDIEQAKRAYKLTTKKEPESIYTVTKQQLEHWLKYGNKRKPVTEQSFIFDIDNQTTQTAFDSVDWTNENQTAAQIIYGWRKEDTNGELTEACTLDAIIHDELEDGAEIDETAIFDALAVENKRLERTAQILGKSLNRTSSALKVVENGIHISKPMRKNGVTNIAIIYELTDGQTVSVLFHNPDTTPNKLKPDDMMIAWRWLLNRKDITIVVAKEKGQDLPIQTIARRVMALVDKNTARFAKANAKKGEETNLIKQLEEENAKLEKRLEYLNKLAEERENGKNPENLEENQQDTNTPLDEQPIELTGKELGDFDTSTEQGKKALREAVADNLGKLVGEWVHNRAMNMDIEIRKRGNKKTLSNSANPKKLKLLAALKRILETAKPDSNTYQDNYKQDKKQSAMQYFHLRNSAVIDGENVHFDVIIEKDNNGALHYDLYLDEDKAKRKAKAVTDSALLEHNSKGNNCLNFGYGKNHTATFDETQEKYVLNLFIFDENGNEIKDEEEVSGSLKQQRFNPENVKPATTEQVNQAVVIPLRKAENSEQAKEQAQLFLRKELINKHSGLPAVVSGNNLSKMLSGKAKKKSVNQQLHELAIANVDELYKNAIYGWAKKDRDNEPSIKAIHRLFATMRTEQGDFIVKLTVKETTRTEQNNGLYTLETLEIEENTPIDTWVEQHIKHDNVQGVESIQSTGGIYNLIQNVQKVNTSQLEFDINQQQTEQQKKVNIHSIAVFNDFIDYLIDQDGKVDIANKVKDFFSDDKDKEDLAELLNRNIFRVKYSITEEFARKFTPQKTLDFIEKLNNIKEEDVKDLIDYGIKFYARDKAKELTHIVKQPEFNKGYEEELEYLQNTTLERRVKDREERNEKIRSKQYELDKFWREPMDAFLATLPKMKALKARSALNRQLMYDLRSLGYDDLGNSGVFYGEKAKLLVILFNKGGWFMRNASRRERIKNSWGEYEYSDFREVNTASEFVHKETGSYLNMTMTDKAFFEFLENNYQKDKE